MLGSLSEADDAVQETWLRESKRLVDYGRGADLPGYVAFANRPCRGVIGSTPGFGHEQADHARPRTRDPACDSVGVALLVVLDRLNPAERLAFVLHDVFAVPFEEIAVILERTPEAARQLASRARRRVQAKESNASAGLPEQRKVVDAFLKALQSGDFDGLVAVLDPDVRVHIDEAAARPGGPREIRGARNWAQGAIAFAQLTRFAQAALVNGSVGVIFAPDGRLSTVLQFTIARGKIVEADIIAEAARLRDLDLAVL